MHGRRLAHYFRRQRPHAGRFRTGGLALRGTGSSTAGNGLRKGGAGAAKLREGIDLGFAWSPCWSLWSEPCGNNKFGSRPIACIITDLTRVYKIWGPSPRIKTGSENRRAAFNRRFGRQDASFHSIRSGFQLLKAHTARAGIARVPALGLLSHSEGFRAARFIRRRLALFSVLFGLRIS